MVLPVTTKKLNHAAHGEALDTITTGLRSRFSFSSTPDNASQRGEGISDSLDHIGEVREGFLEEGKSELKPNRERAGKEGIGRGWVGGLLKTSSSLFHFPLSRMPWRPI